MRRNGLLTASSSLADYSLNLTEEGGYTVKVTGQRGAVEQVIERTFTLDRTPPVLTVLGNGLPLAQGAEFPQPVLLDFSSTDATAVILSATLSGSPVVSGITVSQPGSYTVEVQAVDQAGNTTRISVQFSVRIPPPAIPAGLSGYPLSATSAVLIWSKNADANLAGYRVTRDGNLLTPELIAQPVDEPVSFTDTTVPVGTAAAVYRVMAVNTVGVSSTPTEVTIAFDVAPPATTVVIGLPRWGENPPTTGAVTESYSGQSPMYIGVETSVAFNGVDDLSGVARTEYRFGSGDSYSIYGGSFSGSDFPVKDAVSIIEFRSIDAAGNIEMAGTASIFVDSHPPVAEIVEPAENGSLVGDQAIRGTATDAILKEYRLEYAPSGTSLFIGIQPVSVFTGPVSSGLLARWDTGGLTNGIYVLRLTVIDRLGRASIAMVEVAKTGCRPGVVQPPQILKVPVYVSSIGVKGRESGEMRLPIGVAVSSAGSIYVADTQKQVIDKFRSDTGFDRSIGRHGDSVGEFNQPEGMFIGPSNGKLYVADRNNNRVQVFDLDGGFLFSFGSYGVGNGEFDQPFAVVVDRDGKIFVADTMNHRIQVFDEYGEYLFQFGRSGTGDGEFNQPSGIALGSDCSVFVSDRLNNRVQLFDSTGGFIAALSANGGLKHPTGILLSPDETHLYIADTGHHQIALISRQGAPLARIGGMGTANGMFREPHGMAWNRAGSLLYVADTHNNRVQVFGFQATPPPSLILSAGAEPAVFRLGTGHTSLTYTLGAPAGVRVMVVERKSGKCVWSAPMIEQGNYGGIPGRHSTDWDGRDERGNNVPPGQYSVVVMAGDGLQIKSRAVALKVLESQGRPGGPAGGGTVASGVLPGGATSAVSGAPSSGAGATGSDSGGSTHDNGMDQGANPKDFDRGANPGNHGGK